MTEYVRPLPLRVHRCGHGSWAIIQGERLDPKHAVATGECIAHSYSYWRSDADEKEWLERIVAVWNLAILVYDEHTLPVNSSQRYPTSGNERIDAIGAALTATEDALGVAVSPDWPAQHISKEADRG